MFCTAKFASVQLGFLGKSKRTEEPLASGGDSGTWHTQRDASPLVPYFEKLVEAVSRLVAVIHKGAGKLQRNREVQMSGVHL